MTRWRTLRKAMVAASAGVAFLVGTAIWWKAGLAWHQSAATDPQLVAPPVFVLVWATVLPAGAVLALLRGATAILMAGWLLCLGQMVYWATQYLSSPWWAASGLHPPGLGRMLAYVGIVLALPALGLLLPLPDWLQRRREKAKTDTGVPE